MSVPHRGDFQLSTVQRVRRVTCVNGEVYEVGLGGVESIDEWPVSAQIGTVPWFAVYCGAPEKPVCMVNAAHVVSVFFSGGVKP